jgi:hypothetical protein
MLNAQEDPLVATHQNGCTLAEFRNWATTEFKLGAAKETLSTIVVVIGGEDEADQTISDEQTWRDGLELARTRGAEHPIQIHCTTQAEKSSVDTGLSAREHFRDLNFAVGSTDNNARPRAYQISQTRTTTEAAVLIQTVLSNAVNNMLVNRIACTRADASDLNREAIRLFEGQSDEFSEVRTVAFDELQRWLTTPKPNFENFDEAVSGLQTLLGEHAEIVERLPDRRSEDPVHQGRPRPGDPHKPHQVTGLYWSLLMEMSYMMFINADGCGTGKTHSYLSHLIAATAYWRGSTTPITAPTLIVCPRTLLDKTFDECYDQLGADWSVYYYGEVAGAGGRRLTFDRRHPVFSSPNAAYTVVVASFSQLSICSETAAAIANRRGLFARIIVDEAQSIRRCNGTVQGRVLKSFRARYKNLYTGSPVVDNMRDLRGLLSFLEENHWSSNTDLNLDLAEDDEQRSRYDHFVRSLEPGFQSSPASHGHSASTPEVTDNSWVEDCPSVQNMTKSEIQDKINGGWRCSHWPACLKFNGNRPKSMERRARKKSSKKPGLSMDTEPPFDDNPYDLYHPENLNKLRCCSVKAFDYYIARHMSRNMKENDHLLVGQRVKVILEILFLSRSLYSETVMSDGSTVQVADNIPALNNGTQELRMSTDELSAYQKLEESVSGEFAPDLTAEMAVHSLEEAAVPTKVGSTFAKLSVLSTHLGLAAFHKVSTTVIRQRRAEGLPLFVARMKAKNALNPQDLEKPLDSAEEVLRQFIWGSPKMKFLLWRIQVVVLGELRPSTHRKLLVLCQFPRSAEMILKVSDARDL